MVPPYAEQSRQRMRQDILDAAQDLMLARGWAAASMSGIAARVGLSRQTIYNTVGTKDAVARAVVLRETEAFLAGVSAILDSDDGHPQQTLERAMFYTLHRAADNPLLKAVLTATRDDDLLPLLTTRSEPVLLASRSMVADHVRRHWPLLPDDDVHLVAESAVRLAISHIMLPLDPAEVTARRVARLVHRYLTATPEARS